MLSSYLKTNKTAAFRMTFRQSFIKSLSLAHHKASLITIQVSCNGSSLTVDNRARMRDRNSTSRRNSNGLTQTKQRASTFCLKFSLKKTCFVVKYPLKLIFRLFLVASSIAPHAITSAWDKIGSSVVLVSRAHQTSSSMIGRESRIGQATNGVIKWLIISPLLISTNSFGIVRL